MLTGTLVNTITVITGSIIGLIIGKRIPERIGGAIMKALGLVTIFIGCKGMLDGKDPLIAVIAMVSGAIIGEWLNIDAHFNKWAEKLNETFASKTGGKPVSQGFVTASLLFCVGAMSVVGSLQDGLTADHTILFTKSAMDFTSSAILASTMGFGVTLAAFSVLIYQGFIAVTASFIAPYLNDAAISEMTCTGSILIMALGFNILEITKLKIMNYLPAILMPILIIWLKSLIFP